MFRFAKDLLIIDSETTGVEDHHVICEWGSIRLDRETLQEKSRLSTLVHISKNDLALATPQAMAVHGIDPLILRDPQTCMNPAFLPQAIQAAHGPATGYDLYGMNVLFDTSKLRALCRRYDQSYPFPGERPYSCRERDFQDFLVIFSSLRGLGWGGAGLRSMCTKYNIPFSKDHSAVEDCEILAELLRKVGSEIQRDYKVSFTKAPKCGCEYNAPMVVKSNHRGQFWGCSRYGSDGCQGKTLRIK